MLQTFNTYASLNLSAIVPLNSFNFLLHTFFSSRLTSSSCFIIRYCWWKMLRICFTTTAFYSSDLVSQAPAGHVAMTELVVTIYISGR